MNVLKSSLSAYDIHFIVNELKSLIVPSVVVNIYQVSPSIFILKVHSSKHGTLEVIIDPKRRINVTSYSYPKPDKPPSKCLALRKLINRSVVKEIEQVNLERIVVITLSKGDTTSKLILEIFNGGNIILERGGKIVWILKGRDAGGRKLKVSFPYTPPKRARIGLDGVVAEDFKNIDEPLAKALLSHVGVPVELTREALYRLNINPNVKANSILTSQVAQVFEEIRKLLNEPPNPNIIETDKGLNIHPILFKSESGSVKPYRTFNEAVDDYFKDATIREIYEVKAKSIKDEAERLESTIKIQEAKLAKRYEEAKKLRLKAEKLKANLNIVDELLKHLKNYINNYGWSSLTESIKNGAIKPPLNIIRDVKNKVVEVEIEGELIPVIANKSPYKSIENLYIKAKEIEEKCRRGEEALRALKEKLEILKSRVEEGLKAEISRRRGKAWYERFHWFISSEGFLVIAGRDATQNEVIYRKYINHNDIVLHADIYGSPLTVIKTQGRQPGEQTIIEASIFTASYSKAWRENMVVDVYWVYPDQISKTPPSGTYLKKGSFIITGRKNYVKVPEIKISIGLIKNEHLNIICGPESAVRSKTKIYVSISPGSIDTRAASKIIKKLLMEKLDLKLKDELNSISEDEIRTLLPGKASICK